VHDRYDAIYRLVLTSTLLDSCISISGSKSAGDGTWCTVYVGNLAYKVRMQSHLVTVPHPVLQRLALALAPALELVDYSTQFTSLRRLLILARNSPC
jgi:NO-binding membrane sensor protein with MHYT domain